MNKNVHQVCKKCLEHLQGDNLLDIDIVRNLNGKCDRCGEKGKLQVIMWGCDKCNKTQHLHDTPCKKHKVTPAW